MERASIAKGKFFLWAVVIATVNPILSGIILGAVLWSEPDFRREGKIIAFYSIVWGIIVLLLVNRYRHLLV